MWGHAAAAPCTGSAGFSGREGSRFELDHQGPPGPERTLAFDGHTQLPFKVSYLLPENGVNCWWEPLGKPWLL